MPPSKSVITEKTKNNGKTKEKDERQINEVEEEREEEKEKGEEDELAFHGIHGSLRNRSLELIQ